MKIKTITLDSQREITVKKLGIGHYKDLFASLKNLPGLVADLDTISTEAILAKLPEIVATSVDELVDVLLHFVHESTPITKEEALELGLDEFIMIVEAILEVNNAQYIGEALKKALAARESRKVSTGMIGSTQ